MKAIEIKEKIKNGLKVKVLDIRVKEKYENYHINDAINVEKGKLIANPEVYLTKNEKVYVTCNSGNSASLVANILKNQGYDIESIEEGMNPLVK